MSKINVLDPTVCFKIDSFTRSGRMPLFFFHSLYQTVQMMNQEYNKRSGSYSFVKNLFIHEIRAYATFLLLQFVPKLFSRGNMGKINVLAPTVCLKIDSFTTSGRMPLSAPTVCTKVA